MSRRRSLSAREVEAAGLSPAFLGVPVVSGRAPIAALALLPGGGWHLWRGMPGYRRACRMLRRARAYRRAWLEALRELFDPWGQGLGGEASGPHDRPDTMRGISGGMGPIFWMPEEP